MSEQESLLDNHEPLEDIQYVGLDADGTLWPWGDMMAPAWDAFHDTLTIETQKFGITAEAIRLAMREVFEKERTMDLNHAYVLSQLTVLNQALMVGAWDPPQHTRIVMNASQAFRAGRSRNRYLFPGIPSMLRTLRQAGLKLFVISDAPAGQVAKRVKRYNISPSFERIFAQEDPHFEKDPDDATDNKIIQINRQKPNIDLMHLFELAGWGDVAAEGISAKTVIIGDNPAKDVAAAMRVQCAAILAGWGTTTEENIGILQRYASHEVVSRNIGFMKGPELVSLIMQMRGKLRFAEKVEDVLPLLRIQD
ncbi:MAG: HAD hydrolase-like protein [Candidatus Peregrinibacteria bacterium]